MINNKYILNSDNVGKNVTAFAQKQNDLSLSQFKTIPLHHIKGSIIWIEL